MPGLPSLTDVVAAKARAAERPHSPAADGVGFADVLDAINPLQHIPIVSWAYRALTGDTIREGAKLVGGTLFGGPIGLALAAADTLWERASGHDLGTTVAAWSKRDSRSDSIDGGVAIADAEPRPGAGPMPPEANERTVAEAPVPAAATHDEGAQTGNEPAWQLAAAALPQDQVDLLLRSVGLVPRAPARTPEPETAVVSPERSMPALPVASVAVASLVEAEPAPPAYRRQELTAALAASQELQRAYRRP